MPIRNERAERQAARLRIGRVADLAHQRLDLVAGVLAHQRRVVDDARHGLLRDPGQAGDVVDRRRLAGCGGIGAGGFPADGHGRGGLFNGRAMCCRF